MGECCSCDPNDSEIKNNLALHKNEEKNLHRILLLGPGDSGKTTLLKQMRRINLLENKEKKKNTNNKENNENKQEEPDEDDEKERENRIQYEKASCITKSKFK